MKSLGVAAVVAAAFIVVTAIRSELDTDDVVFGIVLAAAVGIGDYLRRRRRTAKNA